jgi:hypothetical protein
VPAGNTSCDGAREPRLKRPMYRMRHDASNGPRRQLSALNARQRG